MKREILPDSEELELKEKVAAEELSGKLASQFEEDKLMRSVLDNDTDTIEEGKLLSESLNQGISSFMPDMMFENIITNYNNAERIYGEKLIRLLTGYDPGYLKKNIRIPEFKRKLKEDISSNIKNLKRKSLLDDSGSLTSNGLYLASMVLYTEELDDLIPKGFMGKKDNKRVTHYGEKFETKSYSVNDRFRDVEMKKTIRNTIRRNHTEIVKEDIVVSRRKSKGGIEIVYALDASGSMRGKKIEAAKKAGIALSFKAIENRDKVGLIIFGSEIKEFVEPTLDFMHLLRTMTDIKPSNETNFISTINKSIDMFSRKNITKHLIILTDAMPTVGDNPELDTITSVSKAFAHGITISIVGVGLDKNGEVFAKKVIEISGGRLYSIKANESADSLVLQDYYSI